MCNHWVNFVVCSVLVIFLKIKKNSHTLPEAKKGWHLYYRTLVVVKMQIPFVPFSFFPVFEGQYFRDHKDKFLIIQQEIKNHMDMAEFEMVVDYDC